MNFSSLSIQAFKCFIQKQVPFGGLTVLSGANSVGKSSIMQTLLLTRSVIEQGFKYDDSATYKKGIKIPLNQGFNLNLGNRSQVENRYTKKNIQFQFGFNKGSLSINSTPTTNDTTEFHLEVEVKKSLDLDQKISELSIGNYQFQYLNAERLGPRVVYNTISQDYPQVGYQGEYTIHTLSVHGENTDVDKKKTFENDLNLKLRYQTNKWMNFVIPEIDIEAKLNSEINRATVTFNGDTSYNVGFGISYTLPIIVAGLLAREGSMLVVENPEAHLHPYGQSKIGQFLTMIANAGVQVVIETHSEHVINGMRVASLTKYQNYKDVIVNFFTKSEKDDEPEVKTIHFTDSAEFTDFPHGFFDQQEDDFLEIVRYKRLQKANKAANS